MNRNTYYSFFPIKTILEYNLIDLNEKTRIELRNNI